MNSSPHVDLWPIFAMLDYQQARVIDEMTQAGMGIDAQEAVQLDFDFKKQQLRERIIDYHTAKPGTPLTIRSPACDGWHVRLRGGIADFRAPIQVEIPAEELDLVHIVSHGQDRPPVKTLMTTITMSANGQVLTFLPTVDRDLIERMARNVDGHLNFEFLGIVTTLPTVMKRRGEKAQVLKAYEVILVDIRPLAYAIQIVAPTPGEIAYVEQHVAGPSLMQESYKAIVKYLEIQDLNHLPILAEAIKFQILAAGTEGRRASSLLIGSPGTGKRQVAQAAGLIQPIAREVLPTKVTEAGLIGIGRSHGNFMNAGLIPQAHQGVFVLQDAHQANSVKNQRLMSTFATVMQDGVVHDGSASRRSYPASVSIHLDANRRSDVSAKAATKDGIERLISDIRVPLNLLTRFTYIAEITRDVQQQVATSLSILEHKGQLEADEKRVLAQHLRYYQVAIAQMRMTHRVVTVNEDVRQYLIRQVQHIINTTKTRLESYPQYCDFLVRLAEQALMLVEAHARLSNRSLAKQEDVDGIYPYLWRKMDFVRTVLFGGQTLQADVDAAMGGRRRMLRMAMNGRITVTVQQARRAAGITSCTPSTTADDLRALYGDPDEEGRYVVR